MSSTVIYPAQPEQILKGLGKLWTSLGQEEKQQGKPTVLRACAMTLIVATDESDGAFSASQTIAELMREHPSRGIVLTISQVAEHELEARVLAQCWKPFGKAQQICCEQIEITARPEAWPNVGPTLIGLTAADLPVIFWCRHRAALEPTASAENKAGLQAIMSIATKAVVDMQSFSAADALKILAKLQLQGKTVADLEWTRLTRWRAPIAQIFDNPARQNPFSRFKSIEIAYSGDQLPPCALYAGAWFSAPYKAAVLFVQEDSFASGLHRITLKADSEQIVFERTAKDAMSLHSTNGQQRCYTYAERSDKDLMTEELTIGGNDHAFEVTFARAREILNEQR
ncbi:MAG TPA: glucose-6-phosphate dehydrogenase assembly protein OpcA [Bryobacteraceae bacterium]|nr:glucose-6-phosphate dehydrogenase assembly protein OpcA [Bryobacteraceae bacterium]